MGFQRRIWTDRQIAAIVRATLDNGMSAAAAARAAAAGELGEPPFKMPPSTVAYHTRTQRREREIEATPRIARDHLGLAVDELTRRLIQTADTLTRELLAKGRKAEVEQAIRAATLVEKLARLDRTNQPPKPRGRKPSKQTTHTPQPPPGFVSQLAQNLPHEQPPPENASQASTDTSERSPAPNTTRDETPETHTENGVSTSSLPV